MISSGTSRFSCLLPGKFRHWKIISCLSLSENAQVYLIQSPSEEIQKVVKIIPEPYFDKVIWQKVSRFHNSHLCIPEEYIHKKKEYYVFYPQYIPLSSLLLQSSMTISDILTMGSHLCRAARYLLQQNYHAIDINPGNILQSKDGIYLLGDLSLHSAQNEFTPEYTAPETFSVLSDAQIEYSISLLLLTILNHGNLPHSNVPLDFSLPDNLLAAIRTGMSDNPLERFSSLEHMETVLCSLQTEQEVIAYHDTVSIPDRNHSFFQAGTSQTETSLKQLCSREKYIFPVLWTLIGITGCIVLYCLAGFLFRQRSAVGTRYNDRNTVIYKAEAFQKQTSSASASSLPAVCHTLPPRNDMKSTAATGSVNKQQTAESDRELDIRNRKLRSLTLLKSSETGKDIVCLYGEKNRFSSLSGINRFPELKELYLNENRLTEIKSISCLNKLQILCVAGNRINNLSPLKNLTELRYLDISKNPNLTDLSALVNLKKLKTLVVTGTGISRNSLSEFRRSNPDCSIISDYSIP